ncbi:MAG: hypothetical protein HJJLKODD_00782 [Phycisphaerae bacterium]|nr:hypothetical protein [Phycisphaerae bacterium]
MNSRIPKSFSSFVPNNACSALTVLLTVLLWSPLNSYGETATSTQIMNNGTHVAMTRWNGKIAAVSRPISSLPAQLSLWYDANGNNSYDAGEDSTVSSIGGFGTANNPSLTVLNNQLALSYYDSNNTDLLLWYDDGRGGGTAGDGLVNGTETRTIDSTNSVGNYTSITTYNGRLAIAYYYATGADLKLWIDDGYSGGTAGDGIANGSEIRTLESANSIGTYTAITVHKERLAVSYYDATNTALKLWYDDGNGGGTAGDGIANGSELRTIESANTVGQYSSITSWNGYLAISYYYGTSGDLRLWVDDGKSGGTAGDITANGSEIRNIDTSNTTGQYTSITQLNGYLAIAYYDATNTDLKLWYDDGHTGHTAGDGVVDGSPSGSASEIRTLATSNNSGAYASINGYQNQIAVAFGYNTGGADTRGKLYLATLTQDATCTNALTVGPHATYSTIQSAVDYACNDATITVYRNTGASSDCYDEHLVIDKPLTINGNGSCSGACSDSTVARIGPSDGAWDQGKEAVVEINAAPVTLQNFNISGKLNNGAGGSSVYGAGGRESGYGILIKGSGVDEKVTLSNISISHIRDDLVRWQNAPDGYLELKNCYLHHSDTRRAVYLLNGGSSSHPHLLENNLISTTQGIWVDEDVQYLSARYNIIGGWPFWAVLGTGAYANYPEVNGGAGWGTPGAGYENARGWRGYSTCEAGIWFQGNSSNLQAYNNLIIGARVGIRTGTNGLVYNNTIVNPFAALDTDGDTVIEATEVKAATYGIQIQNGFNGLVAMNIVYVDSTVRSGGFAGGNTGGKYYTPGITGYGLAFQGDSGSLGQSAAIVMNNVYGFVDTNGTTSLNYGSGITPGTTNLSKDPLFATDSGADGTAYELYYDNYFLSTTRGGNGAGSCHANVWSGSLGDATFVDMTAQSVFSGLAICSDATDATDSPSIDWGSSDIGSETGAHGNFRNAGAFGGTARASDSPTLKLTALDVGSGGLKNGSESYTGPGLVQARYAGLKQINLYFNRQVSNLSTTYGETFALQDVCGNQLSAPAGWSVTNSSSAPPFKVTLSWTTGYTNQPVKVVIKGSGAYQLVDYQAAALDGEISDPYSGTLPSGNNTAGGDAEFKVYALLGDMDGDRMVEYSDSDTWVTCFVNPPYCTVPLAADLNGDGYINASDIDPINQALFADYWVNTTTDENDGSCSDGDCSLRDALVEIEETQTESTTRFTMDEFPGCNAATIAVTGSALPAINADGTTIDASQPPAGVIIDGNAINSANASGLGITGSDNIIKGLQIINYDAAGGRGIYILSGDNNQIGGILNQSAANQLGEGCRLAGNAYGILIAGTSGNSASTNLIQGNLIGTNLAGTASAANTQGVWLDSYTANTAIGGTTSGQGNWISSNSVYGLYQTGSGTSGTTIRGNYIGTNSSWADLGNGSGGIVIDSGTSITIGGTTAAAANYIAFHNESGNGGGIFTYGGAVTIQGNYIGTNPSGANLGNDTGILIDDGTSSATIGGTAAGAGNTIGRNLFDGVFATSDGGLSTLTIQGNYIGTNSSWADLGNGQNGIVIDTEDSATIGGSVSGATNYIAFHDNSGYAGIKITDGDVTIQNNYLGTNGSNANLGNYYGIRSYSGANVVTIGGTAALQPNIIAHNLDSGVFIDTADTHAIRANRLYENGDINIDLVNGANGNVMSPTIDDAYYSGQTVITLSLVDFNPGATIDIYEDNDYDGDCDVYVTSVADGSNNDKDGMVNGAVTCQFNSSASYFVVMATTSSGNSSEVSSSREVE